MLKPVRSLALVASLFFGLVTSCGLTGKTMKLTDFFKPEMVEMIRAIEKGNEAKARTLIDQGLSLNVHGNAGITPLLWLIMQKDKAAMRLAIQLSADPDFARSNGDTAITMTSGGNDNELLLILLEGGGDANAVDRNGHPAMFAAVAEERIEQIDMLIRFGADINLMDRSDRNSAIYAADLNRYEMVHYLIGQGADYDLRDSGESSIAWQIHNGLSKNLLSPEYPAYGWALKVKQQLIDRGVKFPPLSPREVRWKEGKPNKWDIKAREKEHLEKQGD